MKQTKPKCGAGQSCGFACIEASRTCTEKLDGAISKAAVEALRSHATAALATVASESTDFRGRSFDEVQAKFSANDAKHTIASTVVDHGEGITTQKVTLVASDGSGDTLTHTLLRMAAVPASDENEAQPERIFTLADGAAKEYTDAAKHNYWNESRDSAVRAAIIRQDEPKQETYDMKVTELFAASQKWAKQHGLETHEIDDEDSKFDKGHDIQHLLMHAALGTSSESLAKESGDNDPPGIYEEALVDSFTMLAAGRSKYGEEISVPRGDVEQCVRSTIQAGKELYSSDNPLYNDVEPLVQSLTDRAEKALAGANWQAIKSKSREVSKWFR